MRFPEAGEARAAFDRINERAKAGVTETRPGFHHAGDLSGGGSKRLTGSAADVFRHVYGDLFDIDDLVNGGADALAVASIEVVMRGSDLFSVFMSTILEAVAIGVLMERARWEKGS